MSNDELFEKNNHLLRSLEGNNYLTMINLRLENMQEHYQVDIHIMNQRKVVKDELMKRNTTIIINKELKGGTEIEQRRILPREREVFTKKLINN
jgi:hypothetical protein